MTLKGLWQRAQYAGEQRRWLLGRLGRLADDGVTYVVKIPYRQNYVWVRMGANGDQAPMEAHNKGGVALRGNLPVRMRRDNGVLTIYETDTALLSSDPPAPATPGGVAIHHHRSVAGTPSAANPLSYEVEAKQIDRGRVWSAGGMSVTINAFRYYHGGAWQTWEGGNIDLTSYKPGDAGEWAWVLVGIDPATNTAVAVTGTSVVYATALEYADLDAITFGEYIPCGAVKVRDDDTALTDVTDYIDASQWFGGGPGTTALAVVYVAKTGSDTLDGLNAERPKLTIGAALTVADALITGSVEQVRVEVLDGGTYDEDLDINAGVILHGPAAILIGEIDLACGASVNLHTHYSETTATGTVLLTGSTGRAIYDAKVFDTRGSAGDVTGVIGFVNGTSGGVLLSSIDALFVGEDSGGISDAVTGFGHIHFRIKDLYLAGDNAVGIGPFTAGSNLIGYIDHILEIGTPSNTTAIACNQAGAVIKLVCAEIIADTAYDISAGDVYITCPKITGTRTGTPTAEISDQLVKTAESRPNVLTATAAKTTPIDADSTYIADSAASGNLKTTTWANIKATLKTYFDGLYLIVAGKAGGQTAYGGTGAGENLNLSSTPHATKGRVGLGTVSAYDEANDRLGIGRTNPDEVLEAYRSGASPRIQAYRGDSGVKCQLIAGASFGVFGTGSNHDLAFFTNSGEVSRLTTSGRFGIGTTSPQGPLHIHDSTGGKMFRTLTGIVGSEVDLIAGGAGDVVRAVRIDYVIRGSSSAGTTGTTELITPGSGSVTAPAAGGGCTFKLYSTGQFVVYRSSGAETWTIAVDATWL